MIVLHIYGGPEQQLGQFAFGLACAAQLGVPLRLDLELNNPAGYLDVVVSEGELASGLESAQARAMAVVTDRTVQQATLWDCVRDGVYLSGTWLDFVSGAERVLQLSAYFAPAYAPIMQLRSLMTRIAEMNAAAVNVAPLQPAPPAPSQPSAPPVEAPDLLERIAAFDRPDLIVAICYGDELPVYRHARALWSFYLSHFPNVKVIFPRWTDTLPLGEVRLEHGDLLVGMKGGGFDGKATYASTGVWSQSENAKVVFRQHMVQDYLLRTYRHPFHLLQTTVTSVVDFRALGALLDHLPATRCYAGPVVRLNAPEEYRGQTFLSGANVVISRDVAQLLCDRYNPADRSAMLPNDVWQSLLLHDVPRIAMPTFHFVKRRETRAHGAAIYQLAQRQLREGHYHFRVKTAAPNEGTIRREDIDPWIMLRIMEAVLSTETSPAASVELLGRVARMTDGGAGLPVPSRMTTRLHLGPRDFPMHDGDCPE